MLPCEDHHRDPGPRALNVHIVQVRGHDSACTRVPPCQRRVCQLRAYLPRSSPNRGPPKSADGQGKRHGLRKQMTDAQQLSVQRGALGTR
jgi:hypothetical protein